MAQVVCTRCLESAEPKQAGMSGLAAIVFLVMALAIGAAVPIIGLILVVLIVVGLVRRKLVCAKCDSAETVPLDSERARRLLAEKGDGARMTDVTANAKEAQ